MTQANKTKIETLSGQIGDIRGELESILQEEQDAYDSKSEKWQESDNGEAASQAISELEDVISRLEDAESVSGDIYNQ